MNIGNSHKTKYFVSRLKCLWNLCYAFQSKNFVKKIKGKIAYKFMRISLFFKEFFLLWYACLGKGI